MAISTSTNFKLLTDTKNDLKQNIMTTQEKSKFVKLFTLLTDYRTTSIFEWRVQSMVRDIRKHNAENNDKINQEETLIVLDMLISKYWEHPDTKPE